MVTRGDRIQRGRARMWLIDTSAQSALDGIALASLGFASGSRENGSDRSYLIEPLVVGRRPSHGRRQSVRVILRLRLADRRSLRGLHLATLVSTGPLRQLRINRLVLLSKLIFIHGGHRSLRTRLPVLLARLRLPAKGIRIRITVPLVCAISLAITA